MMTLNIFTGRFVDMQMTAPIYVNQNVFIFRIQQRERGQTYLIELGYDLNIINLLDPEVVQVVVRSSWTRGLVVHTIGMLL